MNGAESLVRSLLASGVDTCFANPGTSEMHFVAALDKVEGMRCILGMAETVVSGCADGYARMAGKPAATLLHCGPGFANSIANVHNARRAFSPKSPGMRRSGLFRLSLRRARRSLIFSIAASWCADFCALGARRLAMHKRLRLASVLQSQPRGDAHGPVSGAVWMGI